MKGGCGASSPFVLSDTVLYRQGWKLNKEKFKEVHNIYRQCGPVSYGTIHGARGEYERGSRSDWGGGGGGVWGGLS